MKVAVIGTGRVGSAQARGFSKAGHEVVMGSRNPSKAGERPGLPILSQSDAVKFGDLVVLAIPYLAMKEVITGIGPEIFNNKIVLDVSNALGAGGEWALGFSTSAAEEIAKMLMGAKVVKAFNTVFAVNQDKGKVGAETLTLFDAGNDPGAKTAVMDYGKTLGFDPVDVGPLSSARYFEAMGLMMISLWLRMGMGLGIGYRLVKG